MKQVKDAVSLYNLSSKMMVDINKLYNECIYEDELSFTLKVQVKTSLEHIRSSLDYIANYLFSTYCKTHYTRSQLNNIEKNIYFPITKSIDQFEKNINKKFKGLPTEFVNLFEKYQPYNNYTWMHNLKELTNKNKHVELIKNNRYESGTINFMELPGIILKNISFFNCKNGIVLNDKALNNKNIHNNHLVKSFDGNISAEYLFGEINTPVISTMEEIIEGAKLLLDELVHVIQR